MQIRAGNDPEITSLQKPPGGGGGRGGGTGASPVQYGTVRDSYPIGEKCSPGQAA